MTLFVKKDYELAEKSIKYDDIADSFFTNIKYELISLVKSDAAETECFMDLLMAAKYLERIADHATNIAEWVQYSISGKR